MLQAEACTQNDKNARSTPHTQKSAMTPTHTLPSPTCCCLIVYCVTVSATLAVVVVAVAARFFAVNLTPSSPRAE